VLTGLVIVAMAALGATLLSPAIATAATLPAGTGALAAVSCPTSTTCIAVGKNTAVTTTDGGNTWISSAIPAGDWSSVSCSSATDCAVAGDDATGSNALVETTTDGGTSWNQAFSEPGFFTAVSCSGGTCVAVGAGVVGSNEQGELATSSGGGAWKAGAAPAGSTYLQSVDCLSATQCWLGGASTAAGIVAVSSNSGATWSPQTLAPFAGQKVQQDTPSSIDFLDPLHGYLTLGSGGCGGPGLIGCGGGIEATSDGGAHWALQEQINNGPTEGHISCVDASHCEVTGGEVAGGVIQVTSDAGVHWGQQGSTLDGQSLAGISCVSGASCIIVGSSKSNDTGTVQINAGPGGTSGGSGPPPPPPAACTAQAASPAPTGKIVRVAGANRDATSVVSSQGRYPAAGSATAVVLASDANYPDALAGTPLAVSKHGPLLLTSPSVLSATVSNEISRVLVKAGTVYLLGGTLALSSAVQSQVQALGYSVQRVAGSDRFATAVAIASVLGDPKTILEATGLDFADALSAGAAAAKAGGAVLLTNGSSQAAETASYLSIHSADTRVAVGGPAAAADPGATPIAGSDRFATATMVASHFFTAPTELGFASGLTFPDALSGGANIGAVGGPMVLVPPCGTLPSSVTVYLGSIAASATGGSLFGGPLAVGDDVLAALEKVA